MKKLNTDEADVILEWNVREAGSMGYDKFFVWADDGVVMKMVPTSYGVSFPEVYSTTRSEAIISTISWVGNGQAGVIGGALSWDNFLGKARRVLHMESLRAMPRFPSGIRVGKGRNTYYDMAVAVWEAQRAMLNSRGECRIVAANGTVVWIEPGRVK